MPTVHLTQQILKAIVSPESGQELYWDTQVKGFGLRVTAKARTYIVQGRVNGRNRRVAIGKFGTFTLDEARKKAREILVQIQNGVDPNKVKAAARVQGITLIQVYADYVSTKQLRPKTLSVYDGVMRRCFEDWQNKPITEVTKDMVERRFNKIGNANGPRGKGEAQAAQAMRLLGSLFNYAQATYETADGKSLVTENPVRRLAYVKKGWSRVPQRQDVLLPQDLEGFYVAVCRLQNQTAQDYLLFVLLTGLRRTEAGALVWDEVDLDNKSLLLPPERTKNHHPHGIPLPAFLVDMLKRRKSETEGAYVFPGGAKSKLPYYSEPQSAMDYVCARLKKKITVHGLRRTFITTGERLRIEPYSLKKLLNHVSKSDVTMGYIITDIERLRDPMNEISRFMLHKMKVE